MSYNVDDVNSWPVFKPLIIAHDVGRTRDRSTAVVGGNSPCGRPVLGIREAEELPQNLYGYQRANALAAIDARHGRNALIVGDLSNDATNAEVLYETFGKRVIGVQITRHGNGDECQWWPVKHGYVPVYNVGRTYLLELFHNELHNHRVRFADGEQMRRAYDQLANLEAEYRESGVVYVCPAGQHDDLGISCAMLAWAAKHRHLEIWSRTMEVARRPRKKRETPNWLAWT
jgi:hypothetical protein